MAENLNYANTEEGESDCYGGISSNCDTDGRLYTWNAALSYCPDGWDLPTTQQYDDLFEAGEKYGISYTFLALKAGFNGASGWSDRGRTSFMWTSEQSKNDATKAWRIYFSGDSYRNTALNLKTNLESVICIKHK